MTSFKQVSRKRMPDRAGCSISICTSLFLLCTLVACQPLRQERVSTAPAIQNTPGQTTQPTKTPHASPSLTSSPAPTPTSEGTSTLIPGQDLGGDCASVESLPPESAEAQQILEEFVANYRKQYPTEYMGMAILHRMDRLGEWAVVQGSVSGEAKDVIAVHQTPQGYQIAERYIITAPLESIDEPEMLVPEYFLGKLPEAPQALFKCLDQTWLLVVGYPEEPSGVYQLVYIGTDDFTTEGVTEINTIQSDGSNLNVLLHEPMLILGLVPSPSGERIAFWGCPGSLANDCLPDDDLDVWVVNWDGSNLTNLTEDFAESDSHPDWSPEGTQIVFDSWRSGKAEIYILQADGSGVRQLTDGAEDNREPKWSPDGKWIAYHCTQASGTGIETRICVVSPDGQPAGEPIAGTTPEWSPTSSQGEVRLAFLCFQDSQSDICTALPDGSGTANLTNSLETSTHLPGRQMGTGWPSFLTEATTLTSIKFV